MQLEIDDGPLLNQLKNNAKQILKLKDGEVQVPPASPLDDEIICSIANLDKYIYATKYHIYHVAKDIRKLWTLLISKSVVCLRFYDTREPYQTLKKKKPQAYGVERLEAYFEEFSNFESLLYGSNKFYRDHVIHLFRTWLIGVNVLLIEISKNKHLIDVFDEDGFEGELSINVYEKISMWTLTALTHDLGYPLEKFQKILDNTKKMMKYFINDPQIQQNFKFTGTQDNINDFILRLISSKMIRIRSNEGNENKDRDEKEGKAKYKARLQSKYYMKFTKSLEEYKHGTISSIILYKSLLYFLESDYNLNEDYYFFEQDARQFYIRRNILRAISSHTCGEIYHLNSNDMSTLLFICDDLQEWGRKRWIELYDGVNRNNVSVRLQNYSREKIEYEISISIKKLEDLSSFVHKFVSIFDSYKLKLRDGQDTVNRNFDMSASFKICAQESNPFYIKCLVPKSTPAFLKAYCNDLRLDEFRKVQTVFEKTMTIANVDQKKKTFTIREKNMASDQLFKV